MASIRVAQEQINADRDGKAERILGRARGPHWERVFRGAGPAGDKGEYWTPEPLAALTFIKPHYGQLLVGTLRLSCDLVFRKSEDWAGDTQHPGDGPPPQDGTDILYYCDCAQQAILWHLGKNRRIDDGDMYAPEEVQRVPIPRFKAYRLISGKAFRSLKRTHSYPYSNALIATVLASSGAFA